MNRQRSGFGLYAAFMVIIVLAMFYITGKISAGSSPSQQKFETAVKDGKVTSAQIVQNKEVPTGSVVVQEQGGDSYTVNVTDVNTAISLLEDADVTYTVQNVQRDSIFMTSVLSDDRSMGRNFPGSRRHFAGTRRIAARRRITEERR